MNGNKLSEPVALRIPIDVLSDIERIAEIGERTRSWVIVRALKAYLATEGQEILDIAKGRDEFDRGAAHDLDEVLDEIEGKHSANNAAA